MAHGDNLEIRALLEIIDEQLVIINRQIGTINDLIALLGKPSGTKAPVITRVKSQVS